MNISEVRRLMLRIGDTYPNWAPREGSDGEWHRFLEDIHPAAANAVLDQWIEAGEEFAPHAGIIRKRVMDAVAQADGTAPPDEDEAHRIAVGLFSSYRGPVHPCVRAAIDAFGPGNAWGMAPDDAATRAQFRDYYRAAVRRWERQSSMARLNPTSLDALTGFLGQIGRPLRELDQ